ncbi:hypothetical protein AUQ39_03620 [Lacticaseibacillus casei]|nr:hypothetical protein AUQ39_03620 [Lacticaseibacillus casei]
MKTLDLHLFQINALSEKLCTKCYSIFMTKGTSKDRLLKDRNKRVNDTSHGNNGNNNGDDFL